MKRTRREKASSSSNRGSSCALLVSHATDSWAREVYDWIGNKRRTVDPSAQTFPLLEHLEKIVNVPLRAASRVYLTCIVECDSLAIRLTPSLRLIYMKLYHSAMLIFQRF